MLPLESSTDFDVPPLLMCSQLAFLFEGPNQACGRRLPVPMVWQCLAAASHCFRDTTEATHMVAEMASLPHASETSLELAQLIAVETHFVSPPFASQSFA